MNAIHTADLVRTADAAGTLLLLALLAIYLAVVVPAELAALLLAGALAVVAASALPFVVDAGVVALLDATDRAA